MRVEYINPFVETSYRVLKDVLGGADVKRGDLYLKSTAMPVMGVAALVGLAGAVSGSMAGSRYYKSLNKTNNPELDNNSFSENEIEEYVPDKLREISLVEKLLLIVEKSAGKISDFEWHIDGYSEKLNVSI